MAAQVPLRQAYIIIQMEIDTENSKILKNQYLHGRYSETKRERCCLVVKISACHIMQLEYFEPRLDSLQAFLVKKCASVYHM